MDFRASRDVEQFPAATQPPASTEGREFSPGAALRVQIDVSLDASDEQAAQVAR